MATIIRFDDALTPPQERKKYTHIDDDGAILNQLLSPYGLKLKGYRESPRIISYIAELPMTANVNKLLKLEPNARIALNCDDVILKVKGNELIIEKPGIHQMFVIRQMVTNGFKVASGLPLIMGIDTSDKKIFTDLSKQPHMLVAGTTGSGKSMFLHQVIISLLLRYPDLQIIAVDTKKVEFNAYEKISNVRCISEASEAVTTLTGLIDVMEQRYTIFAEKGYRDIDQAIADGYKISPIVFIVDEFADLIMHDGYSKIIEESVVRLAQKARAAGIHLVIATQRPTANVITGLIKANIPSRVCLHVNNAMESRIVMDCKGGEKLLGKGDMLFKENDSFEPIRIQACYISPNEMKAIGDVIYNARVELAEQKKESTPVYVENAIISKRRNNNKKTLIDRLFRS